MIKFLSLDLPDIYNKGLEKEHAEKLKHYLEYCYFHLYVGNGGEDAKDLVEEYLKILKSCLGGMFDVSDFPKIKFRNVGEKFKCFYVAYYLSGSLKVIRFSPFNNKKQTSIIKLEFSFLTKEDVGINYRDLHFDLMRSSGAGGQHVNKTESCVRARYGDIVVKVQDSRSQHSNKEKAVKKIKEKLTLGKRKRELEEKSQKNKEEGALSMGCKFDKVASCYGSQFFKCLKTGIKITGSPISKKTVKKFLRCCNIE